MAGQPDLPSNRGRHTLHVAALSAGFCFPHLTQLHREPCLGGRGGILEPLQLPQLIDQLDRITTSQASHLVHHDGECGCVKPDKILHCLTLIDILFYFKTTVEVIANGLKPAFRPLDLQRGGRHRQSLCAPRYPAPKPRADAPPLIELVEPLATLGKRPGAVETPSAESEA